MTKRVNGPQRTCLGCGTRDDRSLMIRIRVSVQGELIADNNSVGRGGYLHRSLNCWERFTRRKSVHRAFHMEIAKRAREKLIKVLKERDGE